MRKLALVLVTATTLAMAAVASPSPAHARYYGYGPGIVGGLVAGALIAGIASSAYAMDRDMATTAVIIPHITADTFPRIMGVTIPNIPAATSTGAFTRPDMSTTAVPVITAVGVAGNVAKVGESELQVFASV